MEDNKRIMTKASLEKLQKGDTDTTGRAAHQNPILCLDPDGKDRRLSMDLREDVPSVSLSGLKTSEEIEEAVIHGEGFSQEVFGESVRIKTGSWVKKLAVVLDKTPVVYCGIEEKQRVGVKVYDSKDKTTPLKSVNQKSSSDTDYDLENGKYYVYWSNNENAGTATVTVVGLNEYAGSITKKYAIKPYAGTGYLNGENIGEADLTYNPKGVTVGEVIEVTTDLGLDLEEGRDYKVTYKNNKKVSTEKSRASLTITFIGNYKGTKGKDGKALMTEFNIKPASLSALGDAVQIVAADKVYTKKNAYVSKPLVTVNGVLLKAADYSVEYYRDNTFAADKKIDSKNPIEFTGDQKDQTVYVKVTGKGNYAPGTGDDYVYGTYKVVKSADTLVTQAVWVFMKLCLLQEKLKGSSHKVLTILK